MRKPLLLCLIAFAFTGLLAQPANFTLTPFANGLSEPMDITNCGDDRIFVVEKDGVIRIVDLSGNVSPDPFLDINARVGSTSSEQGLLGLAFHPDYANNGFFFVNYTNNSGDTRISRFSVTANPDSADANSEVILLTIDQPFSNHNGGGVRFGADGYLYIGMGDGGSAGDPGNRAQNKLNMLGKMLRIDVDNGSPYGIPPSNPFVGNSDYLPEIWALGVRNPWRFNFDRSNGDLWIGDVGQDDMEEVDFESASSPGGKNWGWRCYEGTLPYNTAGCGAAGTYDAPVFTYVNNASTGCAITGGLVYRGAEFPSMYGYYFTTDYCTGKIWWVKETGGNFTNGYIGQFNQYDQVCFGEDRYGAIYLGGYSSNEIWKIEDSNPGCDPVADIFGADSLVFCGDSTADISCAQGNGFTYQWMFNSTPTPDNTPTITVSTNGLYQVIVDNGNCADTSAATYVEFATLPVVNFSGLDTTYCDDDAAVTLVGSPAGGTFSGPGITGDSFDPAAAGTGVHTITYSFTNASGCTNSISFSTEVTTCVATANPIEGLHYSVSPNPSEGEFFVNFTSPGMETFTWNVSDLSGKVIASGTWETQGAREQRIIQLDAAPGIYLLEVNCGITRGFKRLSIQ